MNSCLSLEFQTFPHLRFVEAAVSIYQPPVYESINDGSGKPLRFQRTPAALIQYITDMHIRTTVQIHYHEVGKISFPDKPPFADLETNRHGVGHFFHQFV